MNDSMVDLFSSLQFQRKGNQYVIPNKAGIPFTDIKRSFAKALENAKIESFRFHDLREAEPQSSTIIMVP